MRVTLQYLKDWLQGEFDRFEIDLKVVDAYRTRFISDDYEGGAAYIIFRVSNKDSTLYTTTVLCFYPIWELQEMINNGYKLIYRLKDNKYVSDSTIDIIKTPQQ